MAYIKRCHSLQVLIGEYMIKRVGLDFQLTFWSEVNWPSMLVCHESVEDVLVLSHILWCVHFQKSFIHAVECVYDKAVLNN